MIDKEFITINFEDVYVQLPRDNALHEWDKTKRIMEIFMDEDNRK
jgi:hypothetical protein